MENYHFLPGYDYMGSDIIKSSTLSIEEMFRVSNVVDSVVGFNTMGWFKNDVNLDYLHEPGSFRNEEGKIIHGLYVKKARRIRVKMMCNWCSNRQLLNEFGNMCMNIGDMKKIASEDTRFYYKNIEFVCEDPASYYVIINHPPVNEYYIPSRTIVFTMEPWCPEDKPWGVHMWPTEWREPDEGKFLCVRGRKQEVYNNILNQTELTYTQLMHLNERMMDKNRRNEVSTICSNKNYDVGHEVRLRLLHFLDKKEDMPLNIFNYDNAQKFRHYRGPVTPYIDKSFAFLPFKYHIGIENNCEAGFITEKLVESILLECLCFYYGAPDVGKYYDPECFISINPYDMEETYKVIKNAVEDDLWSKKIDRIRKMKSKILEEMTCFEIVSKIINRNEDILLCNKKLKK